MKILTEEASSIFVTDHVKAKIATGIDYEYGTCTNEFNFFKCEPSALFVLDPRPSHDCMSTIYPPHYEPYNFHKMGKVINFFRSFVQKNKIEHIRQYLSNSSKILDIGCGNGTLLLLIQKYGDPSWQLYANELNQSCVDHLNNNNVTAYSCDYSALKFEGEIDFIILNQVIEHFDRPDKLLSYCNKFLKPGGHIYIETPSTEGLDAKIFKGGTWGGYHFPRHFYLFSNSNLELLLQQCQFQDITCCYLTSPAFWTQSLHHLMIKIGLKRISRLMHLKNLPLTAFFTLFDLLIIKIGGKTSNMRIVAKKHAA